MDQLRGLMGEQERGSAQSHRDTQAILRQSQDAALQDAAQFRAGQQDRLNLAVVLAASAASAYVVSLSVACCAPCYSVSRAHQQGFLFSTAARKPAIQILRIRSLRFGTL